MENDRFAKSRRSFNGRCKYHRRTRCLNRRFLARGVTDKDRNVGSGRTENIFSRVYYV